MTLQDFIFGIGGFNLILVFVLIISRNDKDPKTTLMWVLIMTFIPGIGFILYLFLGQDFKKSQMFDVKTKQDALINGLVKHQLESLRKEAFLKNDEYLLKYDDLINLNLKSDQSIFTSDNNIEVYYWGEEKFEALLKDIENAETSIDMQYYIFKNDQIGMKVLNALTKKARQVVRVRLLIDGVGGRFLDDEDLSDLKQAGGQISYFFPTVLKIVNFRLNYRNHRKLVIIDDKLGYIGGFNVGDDYLGKDKLGPWRDTHLRLEGSSVSGLKLRFLKDWTYASGIETDFREERIRFNNSAGGKSGVQIVTSGPDTEFENIKNAFCKMISNAKHEIIIQSPYFIPDDTIMNLLIIQLAAGVDVKIMIPGNPDHAFVFPAGMFYLGKLVKAGAKVYLYDYGFIHSKNMIVDDSICTIGSANMDIRSFKINFEANAIIYDEKISRSLKEQFEKDAKNSVIMTYEEYLNRSFSLKVKEMFSKFLSPLL